MAGEWRVLNLGEAPLEIIDGDRGTNYPNQAEFSAMGHCLFLNAGNVTTEGFRFSDCAFITPEKDASLRKGKLVRNDVILTTRGTVGNVAYFDDSVPFDNIRINSGMVIFRAQTPALSPRYLYFFVRSALFHSQVSALRTGSAQPQLPIRDINRIEIPIPPLSEQRAIAHILGTLDDKSELNRRTNETLAEMARALFKSWFVDFDPVRAKAAGSDPGLPKPLADLFPNSFEDSELGETPKGWGVWHVADIGNVICGKTPSTQVSEYYGHDVPFITIPDMHGKIFATMTQQKQLSRAGTASQQKKTLPGGAICVSCIATPGLVVITTEEAQTNQQINTVVPARSDETYLWYWSLRNLGDEIRAGGSGGSVLTNLSTGRFAQLRVLVPPAKLRSCYHLLVAPLFNRILANENESRTLAALRDTLLPKLISGELRVQDAERFIEGRQ
jgi:type I restriction enzyme S subunit